MKSVCDVLHGQTPNALYPFLWVHGVESEEELRREVQKIRESGIGGFCVEARPHKDFNGPGWFRDLALLLDEAKRTGMEMWILDDSHFPTGFADGGNDLMCDPAFEGFGFGLTAAQNKRVKSRFVHHRHVGIASFITLI